MFLCKQEKLTFAKFTVNQAEALLFSIEQVFYSLSKFVNVEWFCEIVICAGAEGHDFAVAVIQRGHDNDRCKCKFREFAQHSAYFKPIGVGHHQVEYDQVRAKHQRGVNGLGAVVYSSGFVPN